LLFDQLVCHASGGRTAFVPWVTGNGHHADARSGAHDRSNTGGTTSEMVSNGALTLVNGSITVVPSVPALGHIALLALAISLAFIAFARASDSHGAGRFAGRLFSPSCPGSAAISVLLFLGART
jgi:hypothetical protein